MIWKFSSCYEISLARWPWTLPAGRGVAVMLAPASVLLFAAGSLLADPAGVASAISVREVPLGQGGTCTGRFVRHLLPHVTVGGPQPRTFDSNGAGVALADLNNDSLIDIALAGLGEPITVLWNRDGRSFEPARIDQRDARAINAVDVDGDGALDLVATRTDQRPLWLRGTGAKRTFNTVDDEDFINPAPVYAMAWDDLDADGDLDLVAATYDAELAAIEMLEVHTRFAAGDSGWQERQRGVFVYENLGGPVDRGPFQVGNARMQRLRLAGVADALAVALIDLDGDGSRDIVIGNDYETPDYVYLNTDFGYRMARPFAEMTHNTMGFTSGDIDNDGRLELFAADMSPYRPGADVDAAWTTLLPPEGAEQPPGNQIVANVLYAADAAGNFVNRAPGAGVAATGWTWSVQFGDLDNDGFLDLYAVNGMVGKVFEHLPNAELVEENQALRNDGSGRFVPVPEWGLGATEGGRGMAFADLDLDGDLDVVINNYRVPATWFENQLCGGAALEVDLRQPGSANPFAIGATLRLVTEAGSYRRDLLVASGYLSSEPPRAHFGFPAGTVPQTLEVTWPDGAVTAVTAVQPGTLITVERPGTERGSND